MKDQETPFYQTLAHNIRLYRRGKGISQAVLAEMIGITFQQLQKKETCNQRISVYQLALVAQALEMPVGQLLEGTAFSGLSSLEKRNWQLTQENSHLKKVLEERSHERDVDLP